MTRFRFFSTLLCTLVAATAVAGALPPRVQPVSAAVPNGFADTLVANVPVPTDIAVSPNGKIYVASQSGVLYRLDGSTPVAVLDLSNRVCGNIERGLLGITFDTADPAGGNIFIYYTHNKHGSCTRLSPDAPVNRVSRLNLASGMGSEVVLIDNIPSYAGNHNAGDLEVGRDGLLYIAVGDAGCDLSLPSACAAQNMNATRMHLLLGKILRITRTGGIPGGNPFTGPGTERCNVSGKTTIGKTCQEIYASGLRNPFRMAFDPNSAGTSFRIHDVGQSTWEEINQGLPGADYGWNSREGFCATGSTTICGPVSGLTDPIYTYGHGDCGSITGGAFIPDGVWPSMYDGSYLYADYNCGKIFRLKNGANTTFATGLGDLTTLTFGPAPTGTALYYATYAGGGAIRRIAASGNRPPIAKLTVSATSGALPLVVAFDATTSRDPEGKPLTFAWDFGDGSPTASGSTATHTYQTAVNATATLTVTDNKGATATATILISPGNSPPVPVITSPLLDDTFRVDQLITLDGSASDPDDGALSGQSLSWEVVLHHESHTHPLLPPTSGSSTSFTAPAPEDLLAATNSYLEIRLTATDSRGISVTQSQNLLPAKVDLTFTSTQPGRELLIEGYRYTAPATVTSWAGNPVSVEATDGIASDGQTVRWSSWADGGSRARLLTTPESPTTYTATYVLDSSATLFPVADATVAEATPGAMLGLTTTLQSTAGTGARKRSYLRFELTGRPSTIASASLFLFCRDGTSDAPALRLAGSNWEESTIRWSNAPAPANSTIANHGAFSGGGWLVYDIDPTVLTSSPVTLVLAGEVTDSLSCASREDRAKSPRLVLRGPGDGSSPTTPTRLIGDAPTSSQIDLRWSASSDPSGIAGYDIFRNGVLYATTGRTATFSDRSVSPSGVYRYIIRARDRTGTVSGLSEQATIATPAPTNSATFTPNADASVNRANPNRNAGTDSRLATRGGTDATIAYLRFGVQGLTGGVYRAELRLWVPEEPNAGSSNGPGVSLAVGTWTETGITWNNRPALGQTTVADTGIIRTGRWITFDVTTLITGNGTITLALHQPGTDKVLFASRESSKRPRLLITSFATGGAAAQLTPVTEPLELSPTATSTPTGGTPTSVASIVPSPTFTPTEAVPTPSAPTPTLQPSATATIEPSATATPFEPTPALTPTPTLQPTETSEPVTDG